ncbi:alpha-L-fucosidase 2 [Mariniphaga anaerophila]|uniref:Alpha-L-fucosidase 2 n=1 Tax=Mariniphaga anaerophila TaxID=1484053 RepID=A0A1M5BGY4_9BACT|nr:glycoside hydrolase family 95 protein [Mariniphaga anaerophila]SHF41834.1 alpha-L-fucosidase 2 [Mariniphaga anaerophila]
MKLSNFLFLLLFTGLLFSCNSSFIRKKGTDPSLTLKYDKPADEWTEALPLGNGRIGAMIYGGTKAETIQFNEETLWSGQPHDYAHKGAYNYFEKLRQLLWAGKQAEAHELGNKHFMSEPFGQLSYLPFGNIRLNFPGHEKATGYQRTLDLGNAVSSVSYEVEGVDFKREIFASSPDQALILRIESSENKALNFNVGLDSPHADYKVFVEGDEIVLTGKANNYHEKLGRDGNPYPNSKLTFEARLKVENQGGGLVQNDSSIAVVNARAATLYLVAATSFVDYKNIDANPTARCNEYLSRLDGKPFQTIKEEHISDYHALFNRVSLDLGTSEISNRPTNERLESFYEDEDPSLVALLYQYGRYLLISSSRPGTQPANLQGIWNDRLAPPWDSKYTININTEMNYWPAEMTNLSECAEPLFSMVEDLSVTGQHVAREHYNLNGWVTHHNTDLWRGAAPINNANHGIWPTGGAWLSQHLWWHYEYTGNKNFLKTRAYPVLKEASRFFADYLTPYPQKPEWLVSGPSNSPELGGLVMGPTMDHQIIRNLFVNTIEAAKILEVDKEFSAELETRLKKIAPNQIGQHGQLQEWLEDVDDPNDQHRHVSHLWGLHPGNEIHPLTTPQLAEACKVTLSHRGDGGTGWSRAWKINFWARLLDGDHAFLLLKNLMVPSKSEATDYKDKGGLYFNLFDAHPPFQIDGNFGATSGITEMLLQSHLRDSDGNYFQDLLPALPKKLKDGKISGIKGRGGFELDITWEHGKLVTVKVKSLLGNKLLLRYKGKTIANETDAGKTYLFGPGDFI